MIIITINKWGIIMNNVVNVVITSYNQFKYIFNCIDSVIKQKNINYKLIIIDDSSDDFDKNALDKYIKENKLDNMLSYNILINERNLGTVKTLNNSLNKLEYDYTIFIAADDEISDEYSLSKAIVKFQTLDRTVKLLITQTKMYDETLKIFYYDFMDGKLAKNFNDISHEKLYNILAKGCFLPAGSTFYRTEFIKEKKFDERYELIEDWPMYLYCSRNKIKMFWYDSLTLNHRAGGISHTPETTEKHTRFNIDLYKIHKNELMPYLKQIYLKNKFWVVRTFKYYNKHYYVKTDSDYKKTLEYHIINVMLLIFYNSLKLKDFVKSSLYTTILSTIIMCLFVFNNNPIKLIAKSFIFITLLLYLYNVIYFIICFAKKILRSKEVERR